MRLAVIIAAYGRHQLTETAVAAVHREPGIVDAWVVDNQGDYPASGEDHILRPGENLGWLVGSNLGLAAAQSHGGYDGYVLLNNDVELSPGFFAGLCRTFQRSGAGLVGPTYDGFWEHQHTPAPLDRPGQMWRASFIDGTCIALTANALDTIGGLDPAFRQHGWGGEIDYSLRARRAGHRVVVTAASYLRHANEATALAVHGPGYRDDARRIMYVEMDAKYGKGWDERCGIGVATHNTVITSARRRAAETVFLRSTTAVAGRRARRIPEYVDLSGFDV